MRRTIVTSMLAALSCISAVAASAQGNPNAPGNQNIAQAIQTIATNQAAVLATLANLQQQIAALAPSPASNMRATPPVYYPVTKGIPYRDRALCLVANVSTETRRVRSEIVTEFGTLIQGFGEVDLAAGQISPFGYTVTPPWDDSAMYCRHFVLNGTKDDIRASLHRIIDGEVAAIIPAQ